MFGLTQVYELGTKYENVCESGYDLAGGYGGFSMDLADYMTSNGAFTQCPIPAALARSTRRDGKIWKPTQGRIWGLVYSVIHHSPSLLCDLCVLCG